jgi:hypothetical protein
MAFIRQALIQSNLDYPMHERINGIHVYPLDPDKNIRCKVSDWRTIGSQRLIEWVLLSTSYPRSLTPSYVVERRAREHTWLGRARHVWESKRIWGRRTKWSLFTSNDGITRKITQEDSFSNKNVPTRQGKGFRPPLEHRIFLGKIEKKIHMKFYNPKNPQRWES